MSQCGNAARSLLTPVDLEGRPVRGVTIQVDSTSSAKGGDLSPWLDAVRRGEPSWVAYRHLENDKEKPSAKAETDAQGRFRIEGLGAEKVVRLSIEGPRSPTRTSRS